MIKIDDEILYISMLADELINELKAFNNELRESYENHPYPYCFQSKHKASFNRLRIELNKKCLELSNKFKPS